MKRTTDSPPNAPLLVVTSNHSPVLQLMQVIQHFIGASLFVGGFYLVMNYCKCIIDFHIKQLQKINFPRGATFIGHI